MGFYFNVTRCLTLNFSDSLPVNLLTNRYFNGKLDFWNCFKSCLVYCLGFVVLVICPDFTLFGALVSWLVGLIGLWWMLVYWDCVAVSCLEAVFWEDKELTNI